MVYILLGEGFEEAEALVPCDILRRGSVEVRLAGIGSKTVAGAHGIRVESDIAVEDIDGANAEMIVIPGGLGGVEAIEGSAAASEKIISAHAAGAELAAICAGPRVLAGLGLLAGKNATCYPGMENQMTGGTMKTKKSVIKDDKLTTGRGPGSALDFGFALLEVLRGKAEAKKIREEMHYEYQ